MAEDTVTPPEGAEPSSLSMLDLTKRHGAVLITALLFAAGLYALYRLLAPLDFKEVLVGMRATPGHIYAMAIGATAAGYAALIGYDWSAMRYIGKSVPLLSIALGGFLGYAFGNTIGLSALSGGAVRYRIYSALGLDAYDVAAISSFAALAYGIGATLIGFGALAFHPAALEGITTIAPTTVRLASIAVVLGMIGTLAFIATRRSTLKIGRFSIHAPSGQDIMRQMGFTLVDILMAALALYVLLPSGSLPFSTFLAVFAIATMVGVASHVPGGVGVFESVIIAALPSTVALHEAVTGLLLFRLIYFLLPFVLAIALLSINEIWPTRWRKTGTMAAFKPILGAGRAFLPVALGVMVLTSGIFMMIAGLLPNASATAEELETILPLAMVEGGALTSSIIGSCMVILALGIFRRSRAAFSMVVAALIAGMVAAIVFRSDYDRVILMGVLLMLVLPCRREFYRTARLTQGFLSLRWFLFMAAILGTMTLIVFVVHDSTAFSGEMWWLFAVDEHVPRAQRALLAGAVTLLLGLLITALRARSAIGTPPDDVTLDRARTILEEHGRAGDMLALTGDKQLMFAPDDEAVMAYSVRGASWIALGSPAGTEAASEDLAWAFHDAARASGATPVFYEAPASFMPQSVEMGLALHKMGEEAVMPLGSFSLDGPARKKLRTAHNRALRDGLTLEIIQPPHSEALLGELRTISDAWLAAHGGREKQFSVGQFDNAYLQRFPVATVSMEGRVVAFANLLTARETRTASIDLMRHGADAPSSTMEFLFTALMLHLSKEGYAEFSLGMAPLAGVTARRGSDLWTRFGALVYRHGDKLYSFEGLHRFKDKFDPEWRPRYFCCRSVTLPIARLSDAAFLISGARKELGAS